MHRPIPCGAGNHTLRLWDGNARAMLALGMGTALLPESCMRLPHEGVEFHPLHEVVHSRTLLLWRKENFSQPLQHYIRIVSNRFEGGLGHPVKLLPPGPAKNRALATTLEKVAAEISAS